MTEDNRFRDYAAPGGDFTWSPPSRNGQSPTNSPASPAPQDDETRPVRARTVLTGGDSGAEPPDGDANGNGDRRESGPEHPLPGGPNGTRAYRSPAGRRAAPGAGEPDDAAPSAAQAPGAAQAPTTPEPSPGSYYSEWTANDPTDVFSAIRGTGRGTGRGRPGTSEHEREPVHEEERLRGLGAAYERLSGSLSGRLSGLRRRRESPPPITPQSPRPAPVRASSRLDTDFTGITSYRVPRLSRPFLWCAGADPALIPNRSELYRYSTIGVFVCLVSFVAATMFAVFASVIGGGFSLAVLPFAAIWGILIFWVDRSIVAEPSYGKVLSGTDATGLLDPVGKVRKPGWLTYVMRGVLALGVSFVIAEAVTLLIFHSEVRDQLAFNQNARADRLDATFKAADQDKRKQLDAKYDRVELCATAKSKEKVRDAALRKKQDESLGRRGEGLSGTVGFGPIATKLEADYNKAQREYVTAQGRCDLARDSVSREFKTYEGQERANREAERADVRRNVGWVAQEQALHDFIDNSGSAVVVALPWVLRVTILLLDLLPLSVKLFGGPTVYERRLRELAYSQAYETQRLRDSHIAKIDMRYDLDRLNTRDSYDRGREDIRGPGRSVSGTRIDRNPSP
ncbi:DUF4407 domain-containing protein [Streptosporangium sp. NPDC001559]|uniref:DUF4407 domain-containing protein n=1 Tax=Streptosporangium sp. NPDC001559 TaxID=3366187 RepID=UPI0036F0F7E9